MHHQEYETRLSDYAAALNVTLEALPEAVDILRLRGALRRLRSNDPAEVRGSLEDAARLYRDAPWILADYPLL